MFYSISAPVYALGRLFPAVLKLEENHIAF